MNQPSGGKCRICYKAKEHTQLSVVGCTSLLPSEYTNRHNKVTSYILWMIGKHLSLQVTDKYYEHLSERVINVNGTILYGTYGFSQIEHY
jgi:hypothetical protein